MSNFKELSFFGKSNFFPINRYFSRNFHIENLLKIVNDSSSELVGRCIAAQILCADFASLQHAVNRIIDKLTVVQQVDVTQHFRCTK